jgi:menaquinone-dependent protoporphyrinogen IX oxidase
MKPILVLYATREGQTQRIADHVAASVRARGLLADVVDAARIPPGFSIESWAAVLSPRRFIVDVTNGRL